MSHDLMNDLVRRGDVLDELVKEYNKRWQEGGLKLAWIEKAVDSARPVEVRENAIRKMPSAQPEIVRCHECKWFGRIGCAISIVDDSDKPTENDFCSFAERKGENDEPMD